MFNIFKKKSKKENKEEVNPFKEYQQQFTWMIHNGKTVEEFINDIAKDIEPSIDIKKLSLFLKDYENIYQKEQNEKILYKNPQKPSEILSVKKINNEAYICLSYLKQSNIYKTDFLVKTGDWKDIQKYKQSYIDYLNEEKKFHDFMIEGNQKIDDHTELKIKTSSCHKVIVSLEKDGQSIGERRVSFSPFQTYLRLGIFTVCGASDVNSDEIGKGYGKILYNTIDKILPYQQIPHGYEGAPYQLSSYSENFWKKRNEYRVTPLVLDTFKEQNEEMKRINQVPLDAEVINSGIYSNNLMSGYFACQFPNFKTENLDDKTFLINHKDFRLTSFNEATSKKTKILEKNEMLDVIVNIYKNHFNNNDGYDDFFTIEKMLTIYNKYENYIKKEYPEMEFDKRLSFLPGENLLSNGKNGMK